MWKPVIRRPRTSPFPKGRFRKDRGRRRYRLTSESLERRNLLALLTWVGGASGSWNDPNAWDAQRLPNNGDDVVIPDTAEVSITAPDMYARKVTGGQLIVKSGGNLQVYAGGTVSRLTVEGGSIFFGYIDTMTIQNRLDWSGGTIGSSIAVTLAGTGSIAGPADKFLSARFTIADSLTVSGTGSLIVNGGATGFDIPANSVLNVDGPVRVTTSDNAYGARIYVAGTLRKTGAGEAVVDTRALMQVVIASGTIDVQAGQLTIDSNVGSFENGTFQVAENAAFRLTNGSNNWSGRFSGSGSGRFEFASGNLWTVGSGVEFAFPEGLFQWQGGRLNSNAFALFRNTGWIGISTGGSAVTGPDVFVNEGVVRTSGEVLWNVRIVRNEVSGRIELDDGANLKDGTITNLGTIEKIGGPGTATLALGNTLINSGGTIGANAGSLVLDNSNRFTGATFEIAAGASVETVRDFNFQGTLTGSGGGQFLVRGGGFQTLGTNSLDFPAGMLRIEAGYLGGDTAPIRNEGVLELAGNQDGITFRAYFDNAGTVIQNFTGTSNIYGFAILRNLAGAVWEVRDTGIVRFVDLYNQGIVRGNSGDRTATIGSRLINQPGGTFEVLSGTLALNSGGEYAPMTVHVVAGAELRFSGSQIHYFGTGTFSSTGTGKVRVIGTPLFGQTDATPVFDFAEGILLLDDATQLWDGIRFAGFTEIVADTYVFMRSSESRPITNTGTFRHTGDGTFLINVIGSFHNEGTYELTSDADFQISGVPTGANPVGIVNTGLFRKSGGSGTSALVDPDSLAIARFDNLGIVEVTSGKLILGERLQQLSREGSGTNARNVLTGGTWKVGGSGVLEMPGGTNITPGANLPPIAVNRAEVTFTGTASQFPQFDALARNEGRFALEGGRDFSTLAGLVNTGTIVQGPESRLEVQGSFESSGILRFLIGGSPASGRFGTIETDQQAKLSGQAAVELADGFAPVEGSAYELVRFGTRDGEFVAFDGLEDRFTGSYLPSAFVVVAGAGFVPADLSPRAGSIQLSGQLRPGGVVEIAYGVTNTGAEAFGDWTDSVYLSLDTVLDPNDILVARHVHTGGAEAGYSESFSTTLPAIPAGSYFVLVQADSKRVVSDLDRANDIAVSTARVTIDLDRLEYDRTTTDTIRDGQDLVYRLDVAPGSDVRIDALFAAAFQGEFFVRYGKIPTRSEFDFTASNPTSLARSIRLESPQAGTWYVLVHGLSGAGTGAPVSLTATRTTFAVASASITKFANAGPSTFEIRGTGFVPGTTVELLGAEGSILRAATVDFVDTNTLYASVDFAGLSAGAYRLRVATPNASGELAGGVQVVEPVVNQVQVSVSSPGRIRAGRVYTLRLTWRNAGTTEIAAPLIRLSASNAQLRLPGSSQFGGQEQLILGTSPTGPAGILAPGEEVTQEVEFLPAGSTSFSAFMATAGAAVDWNDVKTQLKPVFFSDTLWNEIFPAFVARAGGDDAAALGRTLAENATRLGMLGERTVRVEQLLAFELSELNLATIALRNTRGTFGVGPTDFFDAQVFENDRQVAFLLPDQNRIALFAKSGSAFVPGAGEFGSLSRAAGKLSYRTEQGETYVFRPDGRLDDYTKRNGQKFTATYDTSGRLAAIVQGSDVLMNFTRDALGRVVSVSDIAGSVTSFTYEGNSLDYRSRTGSGGTTLIRRSEPGGLAGNAVTEIADPFGTAIRFEYDELGRVTGQSFADGSGAATYRYDSTGGLQFSNDAGAGFRLLGNRFGYLGQLIDPVGSPVTTRFDSSGRLTEARLPDGSRYRYESDAQGRVTAVTDPAGAVTRFSYTDSGQLRSYTAPDGTVTLYEYDAHDQVTKIVRADGTTQSFAYSPNGTITTYVNRRGQAVTFEYDARDLLVRRSIAGGETTQFVYDDRGNVLRTVRTENGVSTETFYEYDSRNLLTAVRYPDGRSVESEYDDAGRRTRLVESDVATDFVTRYVYAASGELSAILDEAGEPIVTYLHDASGLLIRQTNADGTFSAWTRNAAGQVTRLVHGNADGTTAASFDYAYDALGRLISSTDASGTTAYGYDAVGQLTSVDVPGGRRIEYLYDSRGNRTSVIDSGTVTTYVTDAMNRYLSAGSSTFAYDADGNLVAETSGGVTTNFVYDALGRLLGTNAPGQIVRLEYDAFGSLEAIVENGVRTRFSVDLGGPVARILARYGESGPAIDRYVFGESLAMSVSGTGSGFYAQDPAGNVTGATDGQGAFTSLRSWLPFGETTIGAVTGFGPFGFSGAAGSTELPGGLVLMGARVYSPTLGRFMSEDPRGIRGGDGNLYRYVRNDPVQTNDPSGLTGFPIELFETAARNLAVEIQAIEAGMAPTMAEFQAVAQGAANRLLFLSQSAGEYALSQLSPAQQRLVKSVYEGTQYLARMRPAAAAGGATGTAAGGSVFAAGLLPGLLIGIPFGFFLDSQIEKNPSLEVYIVNDTLVDILDWTFFTGSASDQVASSDPNAIVGPSGVGASGQTQGQGRFDYTVFFENKPTATAPAQEVFITQRLDDDLDISTFELESFGFSGMTFAIPEGLSSYSVRLDLRQSLGLFVDFEAGIDFATRTVRYVFRSIDPVTLDLTPDALAGFLPPNRTSPEGEGFVSYSAVPARPLASGIRIDEQARIVFDTEAPIDTNVWVNTIDITPPVSSVLPLPATSEPRFLVSWAGSDVSGIVSWDVFVSADGGPFVAFVTGTKATSAMFEGTPGKTYAFFSIATDGVYLREADHGNAQATTRVQLASQGWAVLHEGQPVVAGTPVSLGVAPAGKPGRTETFEIRNDGSEPLVLGQPVLPDGVIVIETPGTIAPGASGWLKVAILAGAKDISGAIEIAAGDSNAPIRIDVAGRSVDGPFVVARDVVIVRPKDRYVGGSNRGLTLGSSPSEIIVRLGLENLGNVRWRGPVGFRAVFERVDGPGDPIVVESNALVRRLSLRPGSILGLRLKFRIPAPSADGLYRLVIVPTGAGVPDAEASSDSAPSLVRIERPQSRVEIAVATTERLVSGQKASVMAEIRNSGNIPWSGLVRFDVIAVRPNSTDVFLLAGGLELKASVGAGKTRASMLRFVVPASAPDWVASEAPRLEPRMTNIS